jgi:hypothetical protein
LLVAQTADEAAAALPGLPLHDMGPFRLLVIAPRERAVRELRWDRHTLDERPHAWEPRHWFSSGCDEPRAQHERGRTARAAWREAGAGSLPWLRRLHGSHEPERGPFCFCMHRRDAATVSYTEIVVTRRAATMRYHDGALCTTAQPAATHTISLRPACKESARPTTNSHPHENHLLTTRPTRRPLLSRSFSPRGEACAVAG